MYNGKLLTPDHGFPVRVIIPGYVGGRMIKWMTNIDLIGTICQDYYHFFDNRYSSSPD
jgi:nitrate reductase (NAD(P)H)